MWQYSGVKLCVLALSPHRTRSLQPDMQDDTSTRQHTVSYIAVRPSAHIKRHEVSQHHTLRDRLQHLCLHRLQRNTHNFTPLYCHTALDHCKHTCQMTPARSTTPSASLRVTIEQISTIIRSIIIHHSVIRCNVHDCIDCNEHAIMLHHYIAATHSITATTHAR